MELDLGSHEACSQGGCLINGGLCKLLLPGACAARSALLALPREKVTGEMGMVVGTQSHLGSGFRKATSSHFPCHCCMLWSGGTLPHTIQILLLREHWNLGSLLMETYPYFQSVCL